MIYRLLTTKQGRMVIANRGGFGSRRRAGGRNRGGGGRAWYGNRQVRFGGAVTSVSFNRRF